MAKKSTAAQPQDDSVQVQTPLDQVVAAEGDAIDTSTLPEGLRSEPTAPAAPAQQAEPELTEVTIGGRTLKLSAEDAEALQAWEAEQIATITRQQTPSTPTQPAPSAEVADPFAGLDELLFTDPKLALSRLAGAIESKLRGEYQQAEVTKNFWNGFYATNPDLKKTELIVNAVLNANFNRLGPMPPDKAATELARLTRQEVLRLSKLGTNQTQSNTEGGGKQKSPPVAKPPEDNSLGSLTSILRRRAAARKTAQASFGKEP